mgnify:CR=1 FL=1
MTSKDDDHDYENDGTEQEKESPGFEVKKQEEEDNNKEEENDDNNNEAVAYATGRVVAYATGRVVTCVNRSTVPGEGAQELQQTQEQYIPCHINADQQAYPGDEGQIAIADMEMNSDTSTDNYSIVDHRNPDDIPTEKSSCATWTCTFCTVAITVVLVRVIIWSLFDDFFYEDED